MPLALPILIPFAELAGIAIGTVSTAIGVTALSNKVEDYIEDNPEQAEKIFAMIMPEQGLAALFNKEADSGDEEVSDEEVEVDSRSKKEIVLEGVRRAREGKGNYSSPDATGPAVSGQGNVIRGLKEAGKIRQDNDPNYDASKKWQGYKKWTKKADGGMTGYANGGGVGSMMQPKKVPMQGGVQNHLGEQKMVTVPQRWQSAEDHPQTELAYITQKEKNLLLKKDIHNSLNGSVNRGPEGVMSLNGWGSTDSNQNVSGATASAAETGGNTERDRADFRAAGMSPQLQQDFRNAAINAGAGQRVNPGFFDSSTFLSPGEIAGAKAYRQDPSNQYANQSYRNTGQTGIMNFVKRGGLFGNLIRGLGQKFGLGKKYNDTSTSISGDFNNNLPLGGSAAFNNLDIRDKFNRTENKIPANITMANGQTITSDQGFVNDPYGTPDQGFVNDPYGTPDQGFQGIGETIASLTNSELPGNNIFADISQPDIKAFMDNSAFFENVDNDTVSEIIKNKTGNTTLTPNEVGIIRKYKNETNTTGQFARNGGIMGYNGY